MSVAVCPDNSLGLCKRREQLEKRWSGITVGIAEIKYQRQVSIVHGDSGNIDNLGNAFLCFLGELSHLGVYLDCVCGWRKEEVIV